MTGAFLAADLVNLAAAQGWSASAVERVLRSHEVRRPAVSRAGAQTLRVWTDRVRVVFESAGTGERCAAINALLADSAAGVYLTTHDGLRPHLHFTPDENDVIGRVMAVTAGGLAFFTVESEGGRLGVCARQDCPTVFVDTSRNGRRAYCSARCGNSDAVQRHRSSRGV